MKIFHIQHPLVPNKGYQENYLPRRQSELGHNVKILTSDIVPEKFSDQVKHDRFKSGKYNYNGVHVYRLNSVSGHGAATYSRGISKIIKEENPDIIHSHRLISLHTLQSLLGHGLTDSKLFIDAHIDNDNFHLNTSIKKYGVKLFKNLVVPIAERKAEKIIGVNPYCVRFLEENLGIAQSNIAFLPLGVDKERFRVSQSARTEVRDSLGYEEDDIVYIFAGNITPTKDIELLINSFEMLQNSRKQLLILGEGDQEYMNDLRALVSKLEIKNRIRFHPFVPHDQLYKYYNAADVGVWPGKLGITIIEAIASGLPVLLPKSPATEFLIKGNGSTFCRGDSSDLCRKMSKFGTDQGFRQKASQNSRELVENNLSWEKIAKQSIRLYENS